MTGMAATMRGDDDDEGATTMSGMSHDEDGGAGLRKILATNVRK
jgi:hypothetical protein